ncbi:MAG: type I-A CRISPR-associated protein Cas7/Csa2 [Candidatus Bathyarchaeia archaeon]
MVFLSLSSRMVVNVEALNMVESVGNISRHRRATIILQTKDGFEKTEVPAISGETIAHAYQESLIKVANATYAGKPPVCKWCARGELFKEMDERHMIDEVKNLKEEGEKYAHEFEKTVVKNCLVEDIGGFLKAEAPPVRRTSRFQVSYMVPAIDAVIYSNLEAQFHARHAPSEPTKAEEARAAQMIYYVETGSAVYSLMFNLDIDGIGCTSLVERAPAVDEDERKRRIRVALGALLNLLSSSDYGAKRTRFLPFIEVKSLLLAISHPLPFTPIPPASKQYIKDTIGKMVNFTHAYEKLKLNETVKLYAFSKEVPIEKAPNVELVSSVEEAFNKVMDYVNEQLKL